MSPESKNRPGAADTSTPAGTVISTVTTPDGFDSRRSEYATSLPWGGFSNPESGSWRLSDRSTDSIAVDDFDSTSSIGASLSTMLTVAWVGDPSV